MSKFQSNRFSARRLDRYPVDGPGVMALPDMLGILVHGNNHFIVRGPLPARTTALALVRHWSLIQIGGKTPPDLDQWRISSQEFRENLAWAVFVPGVGEISPAVAELLQELSGRGIVIQDSRWRCW